MNAIYRALWHETALVVAAGAARWKPGRPAKERRRAYGRYRGQGREAGVPTKYIIGIGYRTVKPFKGLYKPENINV